MSQRRPVLPVRQRRDPVGPWGHYVKDVLVRRGLSYKRAYEPVNEAAHAEGERSVNYGRHTIHNWLGGSVPHPDALRWIAKAWNEPIERVSAQAEAHRTWRYEQRIGAVAPEQGRAVAPLRLQVGPPPEDLGFTSEKLTDASDADALPRGLQASRGATFPAQVADDDLAIAATRLSDRQHLELLRRSLHHAISESATSDTSLIDWEEAVFYHGRATRDRSPDQMLSDLTSDLVELKRALGGVRSSSTMRRLTRITAQMAGLMCLTLIKVDDREGFRNWARTARIAAKEAGDPATYSWVRAQEAYGHYYASDLSQAIEVARDAQARAGHAPFVGAVLAAALEARAHAALGDCRETRAALDRAEAVLSRLEGEALVPSAFGYSEAQLRFHEGSAFTHLHDTAAAWRAQERALALCPTNDYLDRTLTQLDRATCVAHDGDVSGAMTYVTQALASLTSEQRRGIITLRAHGVVAALPRGTESLAAARELRDLVMSAGDADEAAQRVITVRAAMPPDTDAVAWFPAEMGRTHGSPHLDYPGDHLPAVRDATFGTLPAAHTLLAWNEARLVVLLQSTVDQSGHRRESAISLEQVWTPGSPRRVTVSGVAQCLDAGSPPRRIAP